VAFCNFYGYTGSLTTGSFLFRRVRGTAKSDY